MSEINKSKPKRIDLQVSPLILNYVQETVTAVNTNNPSLFEPITLKNQSLSISIFDFDIFLDELRNSKINHFDWQQLKRQFIAELQTALRESEESKVALLHQLDSCLNVRFSEPTPEESQNSNGPSGKRMTEIP